MAAHIVGYIRYGDFKITRAVILIPIGTILAVLCFGSALAWEIFKLGKYDKDLLD